VYAECGGLMYLTRSISNGKKHRMVGLIDAETKMTKKMTLNYTKGSVSVMCVISNPSNNIRGHEFHFSEVNSVSNDSKFAYKLDIGKGIKNKKDGLILYETLASYGHLYFDSSNYAKKLVENCWKFSRRWTGLFLKAKKEIGPDVALIVENDSQIVEINAKKIPGDRLHYHVEIEAI